MINKKIEENFENKIERLKKLNAVAAVLHGLQAVAIIILSKNFAVPVNGSYLTLDKASQKLVSTTTELFSVQLPYLIAIFFGLSSLFHFIITTSYFKIYVKNLKSGMNKLRWIEYSISASVMMVAISLLVGIYDIVSLIAIFSLIAIMNLTGLIMETHNSGQKKVNWLSYYIGCLAGAIPWIAIALTMWLGADHGSRAPTFVYWIFVSIFLFFSCFAFNMILQYKKVGKWQDYLYGEKVYIWLSLIAKTALAWQVFAGTLRP